MRWIVSGKTGRRWRNLTVRLKNRQVVKFEFEYLEYLWLLAQSTKQNRALSVVEGPSQISAGNADRQ
jgi:hypothetical protein